MRRNGSSDSVSLFVSPHLDDVAFSCGGTLLGMCRAGRSIALCTVFTASVPQPSPFALQCQIEKGIPEAVDYLALRRAEDRAFARLAGIYNPIWLSFPEAPNRGYNTSAELLGGIHPKDEETREQLAHHLRALFLDERVREIYAPAANGGHVDHRLVRIAVQEALAGCEEAKLLYLYEELPYAWRRAAPGWAPEHGWIPTACVIDETLDMKLDGAACYTSQIDFQFGGVAQMQSQLRKHSELRTAEWGVRGSVEVFWLVPPPGDAAWFQLARQVAEQGLWLRHRGGGRVVIGCEGTDLSGKSTFANLLANVFHDLGLRAFVLHQDDFLKPRAERCIRGEWSPEGFYQDFWDYQTIVLQIVQPYREGQSVRYLHPKLGFYIDEAERIVDISVGPEDILIVEGLFLLRSEMEGLFDLVVRLVVDRGVALRRALERDVPAMGDARYVRRHYEEVVFPAHARYEAERVPDDRADVIIDNTNPERPRMVRRL